MKSKFSRTTITKYLFSVLAIALSVLLNDILFRACSGMISIFWRKYLIMSVGQSLLWGLVLGSLILLLPRVAGKVLYWIISIAVIIYSIAQFIYYSLFQTYFSFKILGVASEGMDYASDVLGNLSVPFIICIIIELIVLVIISIMIFGKDKPHTNLIIRVAGLALSLLLLVAGINILPGLLGPKDYQNWDTYDQNRYVYDHFIDSGRCMKYGGIYEFIRKDIFNIYDKYYGEEARAYESIAEQFFSDETMSESNDYTGLLSGKNVIVVMMESMDDWLINESDTPTIYRMMQEGINFTNFYSPMFGSGATFNTEFVTNCGLFSPSTGESASGYVNNSFCQALPWRFREAGYTANSFHYNVPEFYNRDKLHAAFGYEHYYCYQDYVDASVESRDDATLPESDALYSLLCPNDRQFMSFVITYSGHLPYEYGYELCEYGFDKFPECRRSDRSEVVNCAEVRARMTDSMFEELLERLRKDGKLDDTVIIAYTDHYTYGIDSDIMAEIEPEDSMIQYERTPFFIYYEGAEATTVDKVCSTQDVLPTILNLFNLSTEYKYIGHDIFSGDYDGYAIFPGGDWVTNECIYDGDVIDGHASDDTISTMSTLANKQININDAILFTDYYRNFEDE